MNVIALAPDLIHACLTKQRTKYLSLIRWSKVAYKRKSLMLDQNNAFGLEYFR